MPEPLSPDLAERARQLGVNQTSGGFGPLYVFLAPTEGAPANRPDMEWGRTPQNAPVGGRQARPTIPETLDDKTASVDQMLQGLFTRSREDLQDLQRRLYEGGYYSVSESNIGWGRADRATVSAFNELLTEAAAYYQAGVKKTPWELLDFAIETRPEAPSQGGVVTTADPAAVRQIVDQVARQTTGGELAPEDRDRIVSQVLSAQRSSEVGRLEQQMAAQRDGFASATGVDPSTIVQQDFDLQARIREAVESQFPYETAGTEGADGYRQFLSLLGPGGVG